MDFKFITDMRNQKSYNILTVYDVFVEKINGFGSLHLQRLRTFWYALLDFFNLHSELVRPLYFLIQS